MSNKHAVKEAPASYQSTPVILGSLDAQSRHSREGGNPLAITENLNLWISATKAKSTSGRGRGSGKSRKIELSGIKKLRELILELAVRGKLVPQNPDDEPASALLKRIESEKAQLIKEGKIKKQKPLPPVTDEEKPFELPQGWEWCRLAKIGWITSSSRVKQKDWKKEGIPFFRAREIVQLSKKGKVDNELYISDDLFQELTKTGTTPEPDDVMLTGVGTIGVPYLVQANDLFYFKDASVLIFKNVTGMYPQYLLKFFKCPLWINSIHKESMGTTVHTLTIVRASETLLPLPPLAEQHRIVAKVEELMTLCDQLEEHSEYQLDAHKQLVETLLATLVESENADDLATNWQRLAQQFDLLFSGALTSTAGIGNGGGEWAIDRLKDTILQLAVMGKLVPQNPDDEPACEIIKRIFIEKERLIKNKTYQKTAKLSPKQHLTWPKGWRDIQIGEICPSIVPSRDKPKSFSGDIPWVTLPDFPSNSFYLDHENTNLKMTLNEINNSNARIIPENSVLMSCVGRFGLTAINKIKVTCNQQVHGFVILAGLSAEFLSIVIKAAAKDLEKVSSTTTIAYVNKSKCESIQFGLPPLAEQHRIVAKVDELFVLCDKLKARLQAASETQLTLTEALVEQALQ